MPDKKQVPLGKPLDLTDEELDLLSEITQEDIANAKRLWVKANPGELADLLDAEETDEGA